MLEQELVFSFDVGSLKIRNDTSNDVDENQTHNDNNRDAKYRGVDFSAFCAHFKIHIPARYTYTYARTPLNTLMNVQVVKLWTCNCACIEDVISRMVQQSVPPPVLGHNNKY